MGEDDDMVKKTVYLGRALEWGENSLSVRARSNVRPLLRELGMESCRSVSTQLCATVEKEGHRSGRPEVSAELATKRRAAVARVVHLAQNRLDLGVAAAELAKTMALPREGDDERLKRVGRYLHGHPDYLQWNPFQEDTDAVVLTTDADWATCKESRHELLGVLLECAEYRKLCGSFIRCVRSSQMIGVGLFIVWTQVLVVPSC